jgi:hypothetical protein
VRALKAEHGLEPDFEAKWTKVSPAKMDFDLGLVDLFLTDERLRFRGLAIAMYETAGFRLLASVSQM